MKMLANITFPMEPFNSMVRSGSAGEMIGQVIEDLNPESILFTEQDGSRGAVMVIEVADASEIPKIAEPWFLCFEANCEFRIAMTPDDLMKADLNKLGERYKKAVHV